MNIQKFVHHVRELQNDVTMILHKIEGELINNPNFLYNDVDETENIKKYYEMLVNIEKDIQNIKKQVTDGKLNEVRRSSHEVRRSSHEKIMVLLGLCYTDEELEVLKHIKPGMKVVGRGGLIKK